MSLTTPTNTRQALPRALLLILVFIGMFVVRVDLLIVLVDQNGNSKLWTSSHDVKMNQKKSHNKLSQGQKQHNNLIKVNQTDNNNNNNKGNDTTSQANSTSTVLISTENSSLIVSAAPEPTSNDGLGELHASITTTPSMFFTVGLEGTGHHFVTRLCAASPKGRLLKQAGLYEPLNDVKLAFEAHMKRCIMPNYDSENSTRTRRQLSILSTSTSTSTSTTKRKLRKGNNITSKAWDTNERKAALHALSQWFTQHNISRATSLNTYEYTPYMDSYPNGFSCHRHAYPDFDFMSHEFQESGMELFMVYIYRDVYDVIASTTINRHYNKDIGVAIQLYKDMLQSIQGQMKRHPHHVVACVGLYDTQQPAAEKFDMLSTWLGYDTPQEFETDFHKIWKQPGSNRNQTEKDAMIPSSNKLQMAELVDLGQETLEICRQAVAQSFPQRRLLQE